MNTNQLPDIDKRNRRGIALITVVSVLAMMVILTVALLSLSQSEKSSSDLQANQEVSRELADVAVNTVMGQIWQGTKRRNMPSEKTRWTWASQPGAVRRYQLDGKFDTGFKLYSDSTMVVSGTGSEETMANDDPPVDWNTLPARYVDLNEPVVRPGLNGAAVPDVIFPIVDPRAYVNSYDTNGTTGPTNTNVEGFYYNATGIAGATLAASAADTTARLPMPVEWLYVLKDGTLGTLNAANDFLKPNGTPLSAQEAELNPIVGRVAFWTDDESCKININTASEPTFWGVPTVFHDRDLAWAQKQPTSYEYQRYPGHPATVALSTVLFPNMSMDLYGKTPGSTEYDRIMRQKESIYSIVPKVNIGGSIVGTLPYWKLVDLDADYKDASTFNKYVDLTQSVKERLYASVDELLFSQRMSADKTRDFNRMVDASGEPTTPIFQTAADLERARFFLTANNRMPETTMFGTPRVAIWPVADESLPNFESFRTGFDKLIAFCASTGKTSTSNTGTSYKNSYYFRRKDHNSTTTDIELARNKSLLNYLDALMAEEMPGNYKIGGKSFQDKYDSDSKQLLVEIFDYIRSTNLYDGFLSPTREEVRAKNGVYDIDAIPNGPGENHKYGQIYRKRDQDPTLRQHKTYTPPRASQTNTQTYSGVTKTERVGWKSYPGHGQVAPSYHATWDAMGFGRFVTVSEAGFHFICTADGTLDKGSYATPEPNGVDADGKKLWKDGPIKSGGRTALKLQVHTGDGSGTGDPDLTPDTYTKEKKPKVYYSNYPPRPTADYFTQLGLSETEPTDSPLNPRNHPAGKPQNWNCTLDNATPLNPGQRRVQGMLALELAVPASGFTKIHPEFTLVIEGLENTKLDGQNLYQEGTTSIVYKSGYELFDTSNARGVGGNVSTFNLATGRYVKSSHGGMNDDQGYDLTGGGDIHRNLRNFDLVTKYVTVGGTKIAFSGADLTIKLYCSHDPAAANLVQTINVKIPSTSLPTPVLATLSADHEQWRDSQGNSSQQLAVEAPHWWSFSYGGAIGRYVGNYRAPTVVTTPDLRTAGRFYPYSTSTDRAGLRGAPRGQSLLFGYDRDNGSYNSQLINPATPAQDNPTDPYGDTGLVDTKPSTTGNDRDSRGADVVFTMVPKHSDTRLLAAKRIVPADDWVEHPKIKNMDQPDPILGKVMMAHTLSRYSSGSEPGYDRGILAERLVNSADYSGDRVPDVAVGGFGAQKYGDFDNAVGNLRDGAYINKADEGNADLLYYPVNNVVERIANAYLGGEVEWVTAEPGESYMTPNRMMPSAGMFGSLPVGVKSGKPWQTLLFRAPTVPKNVPAATIHPGAPQSAGGADPADHLIMDLFWMPVVEPYAISEPFSTAGKVNINYQMVPFNKYIRRSTAVHAALKGEMMTAVPIKDAHRYKRVPSTSAGVKFPEKTADGYSYYNVFSEYNVAVYASARTTNGGDPGSKYWHRAIEAEKRLTGEVYGTIRQMESRFNFSEEAPAESTHGLFRTASQLCEIQLIPKKVAGTIASNGGDGTGNQFKMPYTDTQMQTFWEDRGMTGDNTRERPYANIYGKICTQSNTFRVHFRTQAIRKARSSNPVRFEDGRDSVLTDYRGSALIERRIDPSNPEMQAVDYGASTRPTELRSLDEFYRFRVIETKRFVP